MSASGPNIAGTGADGGGGGTAWVNPGNITANDSVFATCALSASTSNELKATNFHFNVPAGATILGITVEINKKKV